MAELYGALSLGMRDYLAKCKFKSAVLGLSGGVDSAVVAAIAAESLGKDNVVGVSMPSPYSSRGSVDDALALAHNLGIRCLQVPIGDAFTAFKMQFREIFAFCPKTRPKKHAIAPPRHDLDGALEQVLPPPSHDRKQERVGSWLLHYLHGDPAGGLAVISDVPENSRLSARALDQSQSRDHSRLDDRETS